MMKMLKKNAAANQRGFTMVEMLIVLVLVGLVVTFLFSVLGNSFSNASVQQAATKVADDMRSVNDASQKYLVDKAAESTALSGAGTALVDAGYMTVVPVPPASVGGAYAWDTATYKKWGNAANNDTVVKIAITSQQVCSKINELYAGGVAGAAPPAADSGTLDIQCFGAGPYTAVKPLYVH